MFHVAYHWPQHASIKLWPMTINYAIWVFNHLPPVDTGLCLIEMWPQSWTTRDDLRRADVWGFPVYVLEQSLQDGKEIPKRNHDHNLACLFDSHKLIPFWYHWYWMWLLTRLVHNIMWYSMTSLLLSIHYQLKIALTISGLACLSLAEISILILDTAMMGISRPLICHDLMMNGLTQTHSRANVFWFTQELIRQLQLRGEHQMMMQY